MSELTDAQRAKLLKVSQDPSDPDRQTRAIELMRNAGMWSGSVEDYQRKVNSRRETGAQTARLRADEGNTKLETAVDLVSHPLDTLNQIGSQTATVASDALDAGTAGLYRRGRDALYGAVAPGALADIRAGEAQTPDVARNIGRSLPAVAMGAAVGPAISGVLSATGVTAASQAPVAMARRMSEGQDLADAATGGAKDAGVAGLTAGVLAGAPQALQSLVRGNGRFAKLVAARDAARGMPTDGPSAREASLVAADRAAQSLAPDAGPPAAAFTPENLRRLALAEHGTLASEAAAIGRTSPPAAEALQSIRDAYSTANTARAGAQAADALSFKLPRLLGGSGNGQGMRDATQQALGAMSMSPEIAGLAGAAVPPTHDPIATQAVAEQAAQDRVQVARTAEAVKKIERIEKIRAKRPKRRDHLVPESGSTTVEPY